MTPERRQQLMSASRLGRLVAFGHEQPPDPVGSPSVAFAFNPDQERAADGTFGPGGGGDAGADKSTPDKSSPELTYDHLEANLPRSVNPRYAAQVAGTRDASNEDYKDARAHIQEASDTVTRRLKLMGEKYPNEPADEDDQNAAALLKRVLDEGEVARAKRVPDEMEQRLDGMRQARAKTLAAGNELANPGWTIRDAHSHFEVRTPEGKVIATTGTMSPKKFSNPFDAVKATYQYVSKGEGELLVGKTGKVPKHVTAALKKLSQRD